MTPHLARLDTYTVYARTSLCDYALSMKRNNPLGGQAIEELQHIYLEELEKTISGDEAQELGLRLLRIVEMLTRCNRHDQDA